MCCKIVPKVIHRKCGQLAGKLCRFVILSKNRVFGIHFQTRAAACKRVCSMPGGWPQTQCLIPDEWACGDGMQLPRYALVGVQPCSPRGSCRLAGVGLRWAWSAVFEHAELAGAKRSLPGNGGMRRNACARCVVFGGLCPAACAGA